MNKAKPDLERTRVILIYIGASEEYDRQVSGIELLHLLISSGADAGMIIRYLERHLTEEDQKKMGVL